MRALSFRAILPVLLPCVALAVLVGLVALSPPANAASTCFGQAATISGSSGNDTLVGTSGNDVIVGGGGKDNISGGGGDDLICTADAEDGINGGDGNDRVSSGGGYDLIVAGPGDDYVDGGAGNDAVYGGAGVNTLDGGTDNDLCVGGASSNCEEALSSNGPCPAAFAALIGLWNPSRMVVADPCFSVSGRVSSRITAEADGDHTYRLTGDDGNSYHVEFLPRDTGHFVRPAKGSRVSLTGVRATDQNGNLEIHPVFREDYKGATYLSGPRYAGNPSRGYGGPCWLAAGSTCPPWTDATAPSFGQRTLVALGLARRGIPATGPLGVRVRNDNSFAVTARLTALARHMRLRAKAFRVGAHAKKTVKLRLPKPMQRVLQRRHKVRLQLVAKVKDPAGHTRTVKKRVTVRLKPPPRPTSPPRPHRTCDPNYEGACLDPNASDYDCAGGSGNGPRYVAGPITVVGDDHFGLDSDGDGVGCE
jgi:hypothetical protein